MDPTPLTLSIAQYRSDMSIRVHLTDNPIRSDSQYKEVATLPPRISPEGGEEPVRLLHYLTDIGDDGHEGLHYAFTALLTQAFEAGRRFQSAEKRRKKRTPLPKA